MQPPFLGPQLCFGQSSMFYNTKSCRCSQKRREEKTVHLWTAIIHSSKTKWKNSEQMDDGGRKGSRFKIMYIASSHRVWTLFHKQWEVIEDSELGKRCYHFYVFQRLSCGVYFSLREEIRTKEIKSETITVIEARICEGQNSGKRAVNGNGCEKHLEY